MWHSCLALFIARRGFEWLRHSQPPTVLNVNARPLSFQTEYYWSDEMNETLAKNVTVAMASQTALRSNPVYTQVTMIIIQGRRQVVILNTYDC